MRKFLQAFYGMLVAVWVLTSCLGSSESSSTTYNDVSIATFTLGSLNRYLHTTTKDGLDSVYKVVYSAANYKMAIDQIKHTVSNADSLPLGTDAAHVVCTVTAENNGVVFLKSTTSDSVAYFRSGSDSVDFSQPRVFRVYANDGSAYRDYTVSLSVRQQKAGVFQWTVANAGDFPAAGDDSERQKAEAAGMTYLGKTYVEAYAMSSSGRIMESEDGGLTWHEDALDSDPSLLPTSSLAYTAWELDIITDYALLVGQSPDKGSAMTLWRKLADYDMGGQWVYMPLAEDNPYYLPRMDYVALAYYDQQVLAFGCDGHIYISRDQGITWKTSSGYTYPEGFTATTGYKVAVSDDDELWLVDPATGKAWRGSLTK